MKYIFLALTLLFFSSSIKAQMSPSEIPSLDSLKKEVMQLKLDMNQMQVNLDKAGKRSKTGIIVSAIGYSVTIAGGLMLGGSNNDLGEALLYTGGAIGITGTILLVDSFRYLRLAGGKSP